MKKFLLIIAVATAAAIHVKAQRLKVVDSDGNVVSYASVLNPEGDYIGITNLDGILDDVAGARDVTITHVAFKTKRVRLNGEDAVVALEDADFNMPEISVTPKPYIYVQTFYRMYYYSSKDGIMYYRAGLTDNTYEVAKKKMTNSTVHTAKAKYGVLKTILGMLGSKLDRQSNVSPKTFETRLKQWAQPMAITFTNTGPGRQRISDSKGTIGSVTDDVADHQRRYAYNSSIAALHRMEAQGRSKDLEKRQKRKEKRKDEENLDFYLYHIDENGNYALEDFIMSQLMSSYDEEKEDGELEHTVIAVQVFTVDRGYVTKDELKQRKKANKMKMTYANIRQFERDHNIPALAPAVQQKLNELWKSPE